MDGYLDLQTPIDLLKKLKHDYESLQSDCLNSYLAFNFFVTSEHLVDWVLPGRKNADERKRFREGNTILQVCSHLANGMKHFRAEAPHHNSISSVEKNEGYYGSYGLDYYAGTDWGTRIMIELDGDAAKEFGTSANMLELAQRVVRFWENHLGLQNDDTAAWQCIT